MLQVTKPTIFVVTIQTRSTPAQTTVLVAGGGPSGLAAAAELAHQGIDCVVIEPRPEVAHSRPRAKTTNVRTMEHFRRWRIADTVRRAAPLAVSWSQRVTFCASLTGERILDFDGAFGLTTDRVDHFAEPGQQVPQPMVEQVLRGHVLSSRKVDFRVGGSVVGLDDRGAWVDVRVRDAEGVETVISARYVLGCDGASSVTRQQIGASYVGTSDPRPNFNVVFSAPELETPLGRAVQYWIVGSAGAGLMGRLDLSGVWWAIFPGVGPERGAEQASALIEQLVGAKVDHEVLATDSWTARMLISDTFSKGRVYLVGESAHLNPPWGGHGYNTSVGDAVNIAWKIAAVEQGWASADLLDSYEPERRRVVEQTVASAASHLGSLAGDLSADARSIEVAKRSEFYSLGLVLGYSYAGSPAVQPGPMAPPLLDLTVYVPSTAPGGRLPHQWLPDGSSLFDHLGAGMTLLGPLSANADQVERLVARAADRGIPLTCLESPPNYPWRDEFLLIRPDQHIAWRTTQPDDIDLPLVTGHRSPDAWPASRQDDLTRPSVLQGTAPVMDVAGPGDRPAASSQT
ncbi:FAD-dependent monooxygenase [Amycolatopsis sp. H20-H5]|uniref:FAD-dependent monooxygenase n=1 Tax=Amycolatopsis sp. H20-H5 TaxID=3046309 RepID=UPI002DBE74CD|nr:FAD-dependent monooxygenase [Amycolatopsis sp. H20-H5]MEC3974451.1 FAD-dependent monooxygenase [Amycolatopsis sp. H20-H5]